MDWIEESDETWKKNREEREEGKRRVAEYKKMLIPPGPGVHIITNCKKDRRNICPICKDKLSLSKNVLTNCVEGKKHKFHKECIIGLFSSRPLGNDPIPGFRYCPICRRKISLYKIISDKLKSKKRSKKKSKKRSGKKFPYFSFNGKTVRLNKLTDSDKMSLSDNDFEEFRRLCELHGIEYLVRS